MSMVTYAHAFKQATPDIDTAPNGPASHASVVTVAPGLEPAFTETAASKLRRLLLGTAYALRRNRIPALPAIMWMSAEALVAPARARRRLAERTFRTSQGLAGVCEDMSPEAILAGYRQGLFPFCHIRPMKWWGPEERSVLRPKDTRVEKNTRRAIRQKKLRVTFDTDFAAVMRACAEPRPGKTPLTWITPQIMRAYWRLHEAGHAHSVEIWDSEDRLVGGLYGVAVGEVFTIESQFATVRDASKIAFTTLMCHLDHWNFALCDAKWQTAHLASLGFGTVSRDEFLGTLAEHAFKRDRIGPWQTDEALDVAGWQNGK